MKNIHQQIIDSVDRSIEILIENFEKNPCRFFTENDILMEISKVLDRNLPLTCVADCDGNMVDLVHTEYPTPFRCDMGKGRFLLKSDEDLTPKGKWYQRGHYDLLVLNPDFIAANSFTDIRGQDYVALCKNVLDGLTDASPLALYAVELNFLRRRIKTARGLRNAPRFVHQDHKKLLASRSFPGFVSNVRSLVFFAPGSLDCNPVSKDEIRGTMASCGTAEGEVIVVFPQID